MPVDPPGCLIGAERSEFEGNRNLNALQVGLFE
jgi:hypothetical protein